MTRRVLIVDDEPVVLDALESMLRGMNLEVDRAENGQIALKKVIAGKPDLIITDIIMPNMDGWTFVEQLRLRKETMLVPVIFLTQLNKPQDRFKGMRIGCEDYLNKPVNPNILKERVKSVMNRCSMFQEQVQALQKQQPASAAKAPATITPETNVAEANSQAKVPQQRNAVLRGDIEQICFTSVLVVLEMERKTGVLQMKGRNACKLYFRQGSILDATVDDHSEKRGAEVVYDIMTWETGHFEFFHQEVEMEDRIQTPITHLLMEGARLHDEANR